MLLDLLNQCINGVALPPGPALTVSTQGTPVDMNNGVQAIQAVIDVGALGANTTNLQVQIEECATTNGTFTPVNQINGGTMVVAGITTNGQYILKGLTQHRYVRANAVSVQGTTPSVCVCVNLHSERKYAGSGAGYSRSPST